MQTQPICKMNLLFYIFTFELIRFIGKMPFTLQDLKVQAYLHQLDLLYSSLNSNFIHWLFFLNIRLTSDSTHILQSL